MTDIPRSYPVDTPTPTSDFNARCDVCDHVWPVATLPLPLREFVEIASAARCPRGCIGKVLTA